MDTDKFSFESYLIVERNTFNNLLLESRSQRKSDVCFLGKLPGQLDDISNSEAISLPGSLNENIAHSCVMAASHKSFQGSQLADFLSTQILGCYYTTVCNIFIFQKI